MCLDPVTATAVSLGLGAAGSAVNGYEANQTLSDQIRARNKAAKEELARQGVYQGQASDIFNGAVAGFTPEEQAARLAAAKAGNTSFFQSNAPDAATIGSLTTRSANPTVAKDEAARIAAAFDKINDKDIALGNLTGWDALNANNKYDLLGSGRQLDTISDFAGNSSRVNGLEQTAAYNNAYRAPSGLGDLLTFAGNMAGTLPISSAFSAPLAGAKPLGQGGIGHA